MLIQRAILGKEILAELNQAIESARATLSIFVYSASMPNSRTPIPMVRVQERLAQAPQRGLICRAIIAGWKTGTPQDVENRRVATSLAAAGWDCRRATVTPIMHPKCWIFDDDWIVVGSHNSTIAGLAMTKNISIGTNDKNTIRQIAAYFDAEFEKAAKHG